MLVVVVEVIASAVLVGLRVENVRFVMGRWVVAVVTLMSLFMEDALVNVPVTLFVAVPAYAIDVDLVATGVVLLVNVAAVVVFANSVVVFAADFVVAVTPVGSDAVALVMVYVDGKTNELVPFPLGAAVGFAISGVVAIVAFGLFGF